MKKTNRITLLLVLLSMLMLLSAEAQLLKTTGNEYPGAFPLIRNNQPTPFLFDSADASVVRIAVKAVSADLKLISATPAVLPTKPTTNIPYLIVAGTVGQSSLIDLLVKTKKLDTIPLSGKWERFLIKTIQRPFPGVNEALVVVGSDPRGTAYGLFELSRVAGVSPWVWWADAVPEKQKNIFVLPGSYLSKEPSVKFRGIFLNDEDWGLQPWAAKTFEPETGDIGPKTYAKIFELLLRLRANMIWPAMHDCTKAFFSIPGNTKVAADYGILIGSSHAEPMLRNNVSEWKEKTMGPFNYISNRDSVLSYWEERVKESKGINAMYSMGMRGVHDSKMEGVKDSKEAVPLLERIISDQRELLTRDINTDLKAVPQVFTAYKEVLEIYDNGLKLPDDISLVWPDDNYGYIQRLNNEDEKNRSGGSGVYYHASYWGRPHDYLWLSSTHPALIQEEMMKAYHNGSNRLWVLNVGDIKPIEYNIEFFLDMAWDAEPFKNKAYAKQHLQQWAAGLFGKNQAPEIASLLWKYYQLAFQRRPEFMGWSQTEPTTKTNYTAFNHFYYGDEAQQRIDHYQQLENRASTIRKKMTAREQAAYYQLVYYPVRGASLINKKFLYRDKSYLYSQQQRQSAFDYAQQSKAAFDSIRMETEYYNNQLSNGKWKYMLSDQPRKLPVFQEPVLPAIRINPLQSWGIAPEGWVKRDSSLVNDTEEYTLPGINPYHRQTYFIDIFLQENKILDWKAVVSAPWIKISATKGRLLPENGRRQKRLQVQVDWSKIEPKEMQIGEIRFSAAGREITVKIHVGFPAFPNFEGFIENNGYISFQASHYRRLQNQSVSQWETLPGPGYSGESLRAVNDAAAGTEAFTDSTFIKISNAYVEYDFYTFSSALAHLTVFSLPTHPLNNHYSMRYAVSVDNGPLKIINFKTTGRSEEWKQNVLRNRAERKLDLSYLKSGRHTLRVYVIDPGVILDGMLIDLGGLKTGYGQIP